MSNEQSAKPDDRYLLVYFPRGASLEVDRLLAAATPQGTYRFWHSGEPRETGTAAVNGVTISIGDFAHQWEVTGYRLADDNE